MGVYSDGSYGIEPRIMYSFPVTCKSGEWSIVQGKYFDHVLYFVIINSDQKIYSEVGNKMKVKPKLSLVLKF